MDIEIGNTVTISRDASELYKEQYKRKVGTVTEIVDKSKVGPPQVKVYWGSTGEKWMSPSDISLRTR